MQNNSIYYNGNKKEIECRKHQKELEEVEIECGPIRVDDCIGKKMTFLHDPDGCRRDCMNKVGREKAI